MMQPNGSGLHREEVREVNGVLAHSGLKLTREGLLESTENFETLTALVDKHKDGFGGLAGDVLDTLRSLKRKNGVKDFSLAEMYELVSLTIELNRHCKWLLGKRNFHPLFKELFLGKGFLSRQKGVLKLYDGALKPYQKFFNKLSRVNAKRSGLLTGTSAGADAIHLTTSVAFVFALSLALKDFMPAGIGVAALAGMAGEGGAAPEGKKKKKRGRKNMTPEERNAAKKKDLEYTQISRGPHKGTVRGFLVSILIMIIYNIICIVNGDISLGVSNMAPFIDPSGDTTLIKINYGLLFGTFVTGIAQWGESLRSANKAGLKEIELRKDHAKLGEENNTLRMQAVGWSQAVQEGEGRYQYLVQQYNELWKENQGLKERGPGHHIKHVKVPVQSGHQPFKMDRQ